MRCGNRAGPIRFGHGGGLGGTISPIDGGGMRIETATIAKGRATQRHARAFVRSLIGPGIHYWIGISDGDRCGISCRLGTIGDLEGNRKGTVIKDAHLGGGPSGIIEVAVVIQIPGKAQGIAIGIG